MINKEAFEKGFRTKVKEHRTKIASLGQDVSSWAGRTAADLLPANSALMPGDAAIASPFVGAAAGGLGGGLLGAGMGALNGRKDEKGQTHRFRNAVLGGLAGGGLGVVGGGLAGAGVGASIANNPMSYQMAHIPKVLGNSLESAVQPLQEGVHSTVQSAKDFFKSFNR